MPRLIDADKFLEKLGEKKEDQIGFDYDRGYNAMHDKVTKIVGECGVDIIGIIESYWTFDSNQQHTHSWHDKQDCIEAIKTALENKAENIGEVIK